MTNFGVLLCFRSSYHFPPNILTNAIKVVLKSKFSNYFLVIMYFLLPNKNYDFYPFFKNKSKNKNNAHFMNMIYPSIYIQ